jgi:hypothetical protein
MDNEIVWQFLEGDALLDLHTLLACLASVSIDELWSDQTIQGLL